MSGDAVLALTPQGLRTARRIVSLLPGATLYARRGLAGAGDARPYDRLSALLGQLLPGCRRLVLVGAVGIAVRALAPHLRGKGRDPAVVVVDDGGRFAVPLLGAHAAGANALAERLARALGATPVLTTAAEAAGLPPLESVGREQGWRVEASPGALARAMGALLGGEPVGAYCDPGWALPPALADRVEPVARLEDLGRGRFAAVLAVTDRDPGDAPWRARAVLYRPPSLAVGVGCVRGTGEAELAEAVRAALAGAGLAQASVAVLATVDRKRDEPGLRALAARWGLPLRCFPAAELAGVRVPNPSAYVERTLGTPSVAEAAAVRAADGGELVVPKRRTGGVTVAVARRVPVPPGRLYVVGIGPGDPAHLTRRAEEVLRAADVIVGYRGYLDRVRRWLPHGVFVDAAIGEEVRRARLAIARARQGERVALVSGGDAGVFGMAGLVFDLLEAEGGPPVPVEVVPGVTAACAAAALLGAPLMQDFAVISLSDRLTPWEVIARRLEAAAAGDLVVVLYNPAARDRRDPFRQACAILLRHRPPETPTGIVRDAMREEQEVRIVPLGRLAEEAVDMRTTVIVGNAATRVRHRTLWTPRGYRLRQEGEGRDRWSGRC